MQSSTGTRLSIAIMLAVLISIVIMEAKANPSPEHAGEVNVVDAIRYLQDIENKHAQFARPRPNDRNDGVAINALILEILELLHQKHARTPRFGKRGNEYLNKEYTNNFLRFMLENPEYLQQLQQQQDS